jgi:hypothetical protein
MIIIIIIIIITINITITITITITIATTINYTCMGFPSICTTFASFIRGLFQEGGSESSTFLCNAFDGDDDDDDGDKVDGDGIRALYGPRPCRIPLGSWC